MELKDLKDRLRWLRTDKGLTQDEVAQNVGIDVRSVQVHEGGKSSPGPNTLARYVEFYNCDENWLRTGEGKPYSEAIEEMLSFEALEEKRKPSRFRRIFGKQKGRGPEEAEEKAFALAFTSLY